MKDVKFLLVGMQNFCCHIEPLELIFEDGKMIVITGPNGIGKTATIQSLPFTLYGTCEKGGGDDVVNTKVGKDCHTWTEFMIDEDHYRVDRYVKFKSIGNSVTIIKNHAKKPYKKGQREVLSEIESLLVPKKLFTNTLLFSQKIKTFFTDLTDAEQKEIFRKILKLEEYILYQKKANEKLKEVKEVQDKIKNDLEVIIQVQKDVDENIENQLSLMKCFDELKVSELEQLNIQLSEIEKDIEILTHKVSDDNIESLKQKLEDVNKQYVLIKRIIEQFDSELDSSIQAIDAKRKQKRAEFEKQAIEIKGQIDSEQIGVEEKIRKGYESKIGEVTSEIRELTNAHNKLSQERLRHEYEKDTHDNTIGRNSDLIRSKEVEVGKLKDANSKGETCPTCKQEICDTHGIAERISILDKEISELFAENDEADKSIGNEIEEINKIDEQLNGTNENMFKLESVITTLKREMQEEINGVVLDFNDRRIKNTRDVNNAKAKLENICDEEIGKVKQEVNEKYEEAMKNEMSLSSDKDGLGEWIAEAQVTIDNLNYREIDLSIMEKSIKEKQESKFDESSMNSYKAKKKDLIKQTKDITKKASVYTKLLKVLTFWKEGFSSSGIQSMLIDESIPFMNHRASYYLDKLSKGRYSVAFDTMKATKSGEFRDKISVNVFDNVTHADSRTQLSGGQERIVDISTILTLSDLQSNVQNVNFNILLFDEIFDALDDANIEYVSKLLREVVGNKCMFIISHRHIDQIEADEQLSFH